PLPRMKAEHETDADEGSGQDPHHCPHHDHSSSRSRDSRKEARGSTARGSRPEPAAEAREETRRDPRLITFSPTPSTSSFLDHQARGDRELPRTTGPGRRIASRPFPPEACR